MTHPDIEADVLAAAREACEKLGVVARGFTASVAEEAAVDLTVTTVVKNFLCWMTSSTTRDTNSITR